MRMAKDWGAATCCIVWYLMSFAELYSYALSTTRVNLQRVSSAPKMEPTEAIVHPGDNVTYVCSHSSNVTFHWELGREILFYTVQDGSAISLESGETVFYSRLNIYAVTRRMSGEISCWAEEVKANAIGFLIVNGVRNGGSCRKSSDCMTDKAVCLEGICDCPRSYVRLRVRGRGFDVCREMIYSLYDPCEYDEQCANLVDPKSVCKSVCVCAPWAKDRRGKCVAISEITFNRSQEMYRVGLIAVTCIIILIVAVSLWVTLKRSCHDNELQQRTNSYSVPNRLSIDVTTDKPPSYDDVLVTDDTVSPPDIKDALKHCMTAKKLLRQVSAPAGQLLSQPVLNFANQECKKYPT